MPNDKARTEKYCRHCGTVTFFTYSMNEQRYYCTVYERARKKCEYTLGVQSEYQRVEAAG